MNKKGIYILIIIVVVLLLILWISSLTVQPVPEEGQLPEEGEEPLSPEEGQLPEEGEEPLSPEEGQLPEEGEEVIPSEPETIESPLGEFNPEAPVQTNPLTEEELSEEIIRIRATTTGFEPAEFSVEAGSTVSLAVTGVDATHVFKFDDPSLSAVAIGVANGETRGISFVAPDEPGDYTFYCDVPGHRARGEEGVMHVTR